MERPPYTQCSIAAPNVHLSETPQIR